MKKPKGEKIDLLYSKPDKKKTKKATAQKSKGKKAKSDKNSNRINLNNEIIIGLTPKKEEKKNKKKIASKQERKKKKDEKSTKEKAALKKNTVKKQSVKKLNKKFDEKKRANNLRIIRIIGIILIVVTCIVLFMLSSIFNISKITVSNNNKITAEDIILLSGIEEDKNMFKISIWKIEEQMKEKEPYIEEVKITRSFEGVINISVTERTPTYMLEVSNGYAYINNQGYILEISDTLLEAPFLVGAKTEVNDIKPGNRLIKEDLIKLNTVIKVMTAAESNNIESLITSIDISDEKDYILNLQTEGKIVYFGDSSKINQKILWIVTAIKEEQGIEGELFVRNIDKVVFREKV